MGSTLLVLRTLLADQIDADTVTDGSDPSKTLLNTYINNSIRLIARRDMPRELMSSTPVSADIVSGANTVTLPTTSFIPESLYYKSSGGKFQELKQLDYKDLIQSEGANSFFDTGNSGDPSSYSMAGTSIVFNKYFSRSEVGAIKIIGVAPPTVLSADIDTTELPVDYDILITYESAILFAQRDDDEENIGRWTQLARMKRSELVTNLQTNNNRSIGLDPRTFGGRGLSYSNPSVFFGAG